MSWRASSYIKEMQQCPNGEFISKDEKLVGLVLADSHQDKTGVYTYPSVETMAEDARVSVRWCRKVLSNLERKGVIERVYPERQGRGRLTFYTFPELDKERNAPAKVNGKGGTTSTLFSSQRGNKGGTKGDVGRTHTKGRTETETQKQKLIPHIPLADARGSDAPPGLRDASGLFDAARPPAAGAGPPGETGNAAIEAAVEQTMSGCAWTKKRLRGQVRAVLALELDKGAPPATTALAIMAAWKFQGAHSHLLRFKYGPANFLELGIWKDANLLQWDHERMDRNRAPV